MKNVKRGEKKRQNLSSPFNCELANRISDLTNPPLRTAVSFQCSVLNHGYTGRRVLQWSNVSGESQILFHVAVHAADTEVQ